MITKIALGISLAVALVLPASAGLFNDHWKTETLELDAASLSKLVADTGAGDLTIKGVKNLENIKVIARFGGDKIDDSEYILTLSKKGDNAIFKSKIDSSYSSNSYIDIEILIPKRFGLNLDDGSGDTAIKDIDGNTMIDDGSGDLIVQNIGGKLVIDDGSGDLNIDNIKQSLVVEDGSGDLLIESVLGDVKIEDNSGDLRVTNVSGNLRLDDSSGDISLRDIQGSVLLEDSSGEINIHSVGKNTNIEDTSGDINVIGVAGIVTIIDKNGDVFVDGAKDFNITKRGSGDIESRNISSKLM